MDEFYQKIINEPEFRNWSTGGHKSNLIPVIPSRENSGIFRLSEGFENGNQNCATHEHGRLPGTIARTKGDISQDRFSRRTSTLRGSPIIESSRSGTNYTR